MTDKLKSLRDSIDALDARLVKLLSERARARAADRPRRRGRRSLPARARSAGAAARRRAAIRGPLPDARAAARLYRDHVGVPRARRRDDGRVSSGPQGTFSQEAALKHFGGMAPLAPCASIDEVFRRSRPGAVGYGVVPVENSTEGAVGRTLDLLLATPRKVCGEVMLPIRQCLMSKSGKRGRHPQGLSHTQSLAQCQHWLAAHLPQAERIAGRQQCRSRAPRGRETRRGGDREQDRGGALRPEAPRAQHRGRGEEHDALSRASREHDAAPSGKDKTSLILSTRNVPGAMHELLTPLAANGVSMTRLESRPARTGLLGIRVLRRHRRPPAGRQRRARARASSSARRRSSRTSAPIPVAAVS